MFTRWISGSRLQVGSASVVLGVFGCFGDVSVFGMVRIFREDRRKEDEEWRSQTTLMAFTMCTRNN